VPDYGRERVTLVEIDQPLCTRLYGDGLGSPTPAAGCTAVLGATELHKCFNGRASCQDTANYAPATLTLRFALPQHELTRHYGYVIPSLVSVSTTPGALNLAAMYGSAGALGQREVMTLVFQDHRHSDLLVDKYRLERRTGAAQFGSPSDTYDPYTRGTFWGKWLARNPYHAGYALRVYEGFLGDALADMRVRHYIVDRIEGPAEGEVRVVAKDTLSKLEAKKAVAPAASRGELGANITAVSSSATLSPSGIGEEDYPHRDGSPSEMYLAIGDELVKASRVSDTLTLTQRGAFGTTAAAHNDEDLVQWVLVYFAQRAHVIVYDLLVNYAGIDAASIDFDDWEAQAAEITELYTGLIAEPTPVQDLVGELCQQAGFTVWHDPATGMINLRALRASSSIATITDDAWIVEGSLRTKRQDDKRVSQVWVYYGQKNPLEDQDDRRNYYSRVVVIDPDAEGEEQYGTPKVQEIFSRWIPQFGRESAVSTGERILSIFRDPPVEARFSVDAVRDEALALARFVTLETSELQDETGDVEDATQFAVVSLERSEAQVHVVAQEVTFAAVPGGSGSENDPRTIYIENNAYNLNLRTIHDSLYEAPVEGSPSLAVTFVVVSGVIIGSTSYDYAMRTGSWPSTTDLYLTNNGRIAGKGGAGGYGGSPAGAPASAGADGGPALLVERRLVIDNTNGQIWGGGGGGGGGGAAVDFVDIFGGLYFYYGGGGAGGGAGTNAGAGGAAGTGIDGNGIAGSDGTATAGGSGGNGAYPAGAGGAGGGPGLVGVAGTAGAGNYANGPGGAGGAIGAYLVGNSFVTWTAVGDVRGGVA
jgi:hypothetical protein